MHGNLLCSHSPSLELVYKHSTLNGTGMQTKLLDRQRSNIGYIAEYDLYRKLAAYIRKSFSERDCVGAVMAPAIACITVSQLAPAFDIRFVTDHEVSHQGSLMPIKYS